MCVSVKAPAPPPMPDPAPIAPPASKKTQASAMPAGYSEGSRNKKSASSYDRKRTGASKLRIPIIGGVE
mgnify:CR=1 FL=1